MLKLMDKKIFTVLGSKFFFSGPVGDHWKYLYETQNNPRDFLRPDLGPNISPFSIKNEQNLLKMAYIIPNFLVLHFGENFMKIQTKTSKVTDD